VLHVPLRAVATLLAAAIVATGCGPAAPATEAEPPFPGVQQAVHQSLGRVEPPTVERLNFQDGAAVAVFGRRQVAQGYGEAVWFATATTFALQTMVPGYGRGPGHFKRHTGRMTAAMAHRTDEVVDECFDAGDRAACDLVYRWRLYWNDAEKYRLQDQGPLVVDHGIREAAVWVDQLGDQPRLAVRFEQAAKVRVHRGDEDLLLPVVKDATYWLVPAPEGTNYNWQIDRVDAALVEQEPVPDTGTY